MELAAPPSRDPAGGAAMRSSVRRQLEAQRRDLLVLVYYHLLEEGLPLAAQHLREAKLLNGTWDVASHVVCDNVDLGLVLSDFVSYYRQRFHRSPMLCRPKDPPATGVSAGRQTRRQPQPRQAPPPAPGTGVQALQAGVGTIPTPKPSPERWPVSPASVRAPDDDGGGPGTAPRIFGVGPRGHELQLPPSRSISLPKYMAANEELRELASTIAGDVVALPDDDVVEDGPGWEQVTGLDEAKEAIEDCFIYPLRHPDLYPAAANHSNAVLLCGPPGTGKTMLARATAARVTEASGPISVFFNLHASSLASKWRGESEKMVRVLFDLARHNSPAVIFLDEADALLGDRGGPGEHESSRRCKAEFLVQLDGLVRDSSPVLFLAATNLPWTIDPGLLRRFHKVVHVDLPDLEERQRILSFHLRKLRLEGKALEKVDVDLVASTTAGFSGADLQRVCSIAAKGLLRARVLNLEAAAQGNGRAWSRANNKPSCLQLKTDDLQKAASTVRPLGESWQLRYERWKTGRTSKG